MLQSNDDKWPIWGEQYEDDQVKPEQKSSSNKTPIVSQNKSHVGSTQDSKRSTESISEGMRYISLGTEFFAAILVGTLLGLGARWVISSLTGYRPAWVIVVGILIGALAGFLNMYRFIVEQEQKEEQKKRGS